MSLNPADNAAHPATEWAARAASYADEAARWNLTYARRLIELVALQPGDRVLDVATGPGVVAVEAVRALGDSTAVLATDYEPSWEAYVQAAATAAGLEPPRFATMSADQLDLADASFDVVLCQFGLMFVPEPARALAEFRRVLKPGGRVGVAVWSTPDKVGIFRTMGLIRRELPEEPPGTSTPGPLSLSEPGLIESLVTGAGFTDVHVEYVVGTSVIESPEAAWERWGSTGMMASRLATQSERERERIRQVVLDALNAMTEPDGTIPLSSEAVLVTARA